MDPQLWKQVDELFEQALEQPPELRKSFVAQASKGNAIIYEEVLSLLDAQGRAVDFFAGNKGVHQRYKKQESARDILFERRQTAQHRHLNGWDASLFHGILVRERYLVIGFAVNDQSIVPLRTV